MYYSVAHQLLTSSLFAVPHFLFSFMQMGNTIAVKDAQVAPHVHYHAHQHSYYTLIMADPDAPSRQNATYRSYLHWLVVNSKHACLFHCV